MAKPNQPQNQNSKWENFLEKYQAVRKDVLARQSQPPGSTTSKPANNTARTNNSGGTNNKNPYAANKNSVSSAKSAASQPKAAKAPAQQSGNTSNRYSGQQKTKTQQPSQTRTGTIASVGAQTAQATASAPQAQRAKPQTANVPAYTNPLSDKEKWSELGEAFKRRADRNGMVRIIKPDGTSDLSPREGNLFAELFGKTMAENAGVPFKEYASGAAAKLPTQYEIGGLVQNIPHPKDISASTKKPTWQQPLPEIGGFPYDPHQAEPLIKRLNKVGDPRQKLAGQNLQLADYGFGPVAEQHPRDRSIKEELSAFSSEIIHKPIQKAVTAKVADRLRNFGPSQDLGAVCKEHAEEHRETHNQLVFPTYDPLSKTVGIVDVKGYIITQDLFPSDWSFGLGTINDNGCSAIAEYNALKIFGDERANFADIIYKHESEGKLLFGGLFGAAPADVQEVMNDFGYSTVLIEDSEELSTAAKGIPDSDAIIISYWNKSGNVSDGMHFVALDVAVDPNGSACFRPLNVTVKKTGYRYYSIDEFISEKNGVLLSIMSIDLPSRKESQRNE